MWRDSIPLAHNASIDSDISNFWQTVSAWKIHMAIVGVNIFHFFLLLIKEGRIDKKLNKIYLGIEIGFIGTRVVIMKY